MIDRIFPGIPRPAAWLGLAGAIPFYAGAIGGWVLPAPYAAWSFQYMLWYAAIILSFLGGVHWGLAVGGFGGPRVMDPMEEPPQTMGWARLGWAVVPSLVGWAGLMVQNFGFQIVLFTLAFVTMLLGDLRAAERGYAPFWYLSLRRNLTWLVMGGLAIAVARTALVLGS